MNNKKIRGYLLFFVPLLVVFTAGLILRFSLVESEVAAKTNPMPQDAAISEFVARDEAPTFASESVHGIAFEAKVVRANLSTKRIVIHLCYDLLEPREWSLGNSTLYDSRGNTAHLQEIALLDVLLPPVIVDGQPVQEVLNFSGSGEAQYYVEAKEIRDKGRICVAATHYLAQSDFDASDFHIVINSLERKPYEGEACEPAYQEEVQRALDAQGTGVKIKVVKEMVDDTYYQCQIDIASKPEEMSMQQAFRHYWDVHVLYGDWKIKVDLPDETN
jgi:hypothetical protein